jgi:hypothetical protein
MVKKKKGDYEVGRGKPPKHTQFKPGESGNPKGKSKGTKNFKTYLFNEMNAKVVISENGKQKKLTRLEAFTKRMMEKALNGDPRFAKLLTDLIARYDADMSEDINTETLSETEARILERFKQKVIQEAKDKGEVK